MSLWRQSGSRKSQSRFPGPGPPHAVHPKGPSVRPVSPATTALAEPCASSFGQLSTACTLPSSALNVWPCRGRSSVPTEQRQRRRGGRLAPVPNAPRVAAAEPACGTAAAKEAASPGLRVTPGRVAAGHGQQRKTNSGTKSEAGQRGVGGLYNTPIRPFLGYPQALF